MFAIYLLNVIYSQLFHFLKFGACRHSWMFYLFSISIISLSMTARTIENNQNCFLTFIYVFVWVIIIIENWYYAFRFDCPCIPSIGTLAKHKMWTNDNNRIIYLLFFQRKITTWAIKCIVILHFEQFQCFWWWMVIYTAHFMKVLATVIMNLSVYACVWSLTINQWRIIHLWHGKNVTWRWKYNIQLILSNFIYSRRHTHIISVCHNFTEV